MTGHPEIDAIVDRAAAYQREVSTKLGQPPITFLVTEEEYERLQMWWRDPDYRDYHGGGGTMGWTTSGLMSIFGMRVAMRLLWDGGHDHMGHFKRVLFVDDRDPRGDLFAPWILCRTDRPRVEVREIGCPCGQVVWELLPERSVVTIWGMPVIIDPTVPRGHFRLVGRTRPDWEESRSSLISAEAPSPAHVADSERSSVEEWSDQVDALLVEYKRHVDAGERS